MLDGLAFGRCNNGFRRLRETKGRGPGRALPEGRPRTRPGGPQAARGSRPLPMVGPAAARLLQRPLRAPGGSQNDKLAETRPVETRPVGRWLMER